MEHTPGPWKFIENKDTANVFDYGYIMADTYIATINDPIAPASLPKSEIQANARLIVAAPDLLEACEIVLHSQCTGHTHGAYHLHIKTDDMAKIQTIVNKAKGA
jgi:hypothetical protein